MTSQSVSFWKLGSLALAAAAFMAACSPDAPLIGKGGACSDAKKCVPGLVCKDGTCQEDTKVLSVCTPDKKRCAGATVEKCKSDASGWDFQESCAGGCQAGQDTAACIVQICDPNSTDASKRIQCQGDEVMVCRADGTGFDPSPEGKCALGCDPVTASCNAGVCIPGHRRCRADGTIETCKSNGSAWGEPETCDGRCVDNGLAGTAQSANCIKTNCTPGVIRCDGLDVVKCTEDGNGENVITTCAHACAGTGVCGEASCTPGETRCSTDGKSIQRCNALGSDYDTTSCDLAGTGTGLCLLAQGSPGADAARCISPICTANAVRCTKDRVLTCSDDGLSEAVTETCAFGCAADGKTCAPPACAANQRRCSADNSDVIENCAPDRRSWTFGEYCQGGCVSDSQTAAGARCGSTVCPPLVGRCNAQGQLETCRADGRGYDAAVACEPGNVCDRGACVPAPSDCTAGTSRCNGRDLEACTGTPSHFNKTGSCLGRCAGDGCDAAGSCGPITLKVPLVTSTANGLVLPADGQSTFLVLSDPLVGPTGQPVPDGTLVTVAVNADTAAPTLMSGDADAVTPGLQLPVVDGRIDFVVRVPQLTTGTATAAIKAQIGDRAPCSGTVGVTFDASVADTRYLAEDFTTTRARDGSGPITQWDTRKGVLNLTAFDAGDGRDGDLTVDVGATVDLSVRTSNGHTYPDMAMAPVREIRNALVGVDGSLDAFKVPGTRVMLINLRGAPGRVSNVGAWEQATVDGVEGGYLRLSANVARTYGEGGNTLEAMSDQSVRIVRVPQYGKVTVNGTLTAQALTDTAQGPMGGVLVFMANSTTAAGTGASKVSTTGHITMSGKGYRGAAKPADVALASSSSGGRNYYYGAGANSLSGEGLEGGRNLATSVGATYAGGGYCCGSGDVPPAQSGQPAAYADQVDQVYVGVSGSHATTGQASCATGPGITYGDGLLGRLYMGGGSGSVTRSTAHSCDNKRRCNRIGGVPGNACCTSGELASPLAKGDGLTPVTVQTASYNLGNNPSYPGGGCGSANTGCASPTPAPSGAGTFCNPATGGCNATCATASLIDYCDAKVYLFDASFAGAPGGGVIFATFAELDASDSGATIEAKGTPTGYCDYGTSSVGRLPTKCYGGAGGSIYLRTGSIKLGGASPVRISADGGTQGAVNGGGAGRVRIDYVSSQDTGFAPTFTSPAASLVTLDSDTVRSIVVMSLTGKVFSNATGLVLPVGSALPLDPATGLVKVGAANTQSQLTLGLSADSGATFGNAKLTDGTLAFSATASPAQGAAAKWRLSPTAGFPNGATRGFSVKYTIK